MSSDQNQKGQLALKTPAVPSPAPVDLSEMKVLHQANLQLLNEAMERKEGKDSLFNAKIATLIKQVKNGNQSNIEKIGGDIYKLREEMSKQYQEHIRLMDQMTGTSQVIQRTGVNLGLQLVQQPQGAPVSQSALNELIIQRVNDNELMREELHNKVRRDAGEIAQLRLNLDKLTRKDMETSSSILMLEANNETLRKELDQKEEHMRKELDQKEEHMKRMQKKIQELQTERDELQDALSKVRDDVRSLNSENRKLRGVVAAQQTQIVEMEEQNKIMNNKLTAQQTQMGEMEEQNKIMNNSLTAQQSQMGEMMSMMKEMTEQYRKEKEAGEINVEKKALISLGQAATNFVNKVYEKVHPNIYKRDLIYTFDDIENHISSKKYKKSQEKLDSARQRWDDIRQKLETDAPQWQGTIRYLKQQRNNVAHPDVPPEEALSCLTLLHNNQILDDEIYQEMGCIIEKWQAM